MEGAERRVDLKSRRRAVAHGGYELSWDVDRGPVNRLIARSGNEFPSSFIWTGALRQNRYRPANTLCIGSAETPSSAPILA